MECQFHHANIAVSWFLADIARLRQFAIVSIDTEFEVETSIRIQFSSDIFGIALSFKCFCEPFMIR